MAAAGAKVWVGRVISGLVCLMFAFAGLMKLKGGPELEQGFAHMGIPVSMRIPLAILELGCVVLYAIPATAVLGAILLAGFMGGAILTHWRIGEPIVVQTALGLLAWLALYLREPRLKDLIPVRKP
jgi:uncharacterized membrane protein YphA (DoxX/SURF4 family)